jgi:hypothetical protein
MQLLRHELPPDPSARARGSSPQWSPTPGDGMSPSRPARCHGLRSLASAGTRGARHSRGWQPSCVALPLRGRVQTPAIEGSPNRLSVDVTSRLGRSYGTHHGGRRNRGGTASVETDGMDLVVVEGDRSVEPPWPTSACFSMTRAAPARRARPSCVARRGASSTSRSRWPSRDRRGSSRRRAPWHR